jgi:putative endonuclease
MPSAKTKFGLLGEKVAAKYLTNKNFEIIRTNYQNQSGRRLGEIDIIAKDRTRDEIVFVEVKTRELRKFEHTLPEENITYSKLRKLQKIANAYLSHHHLEKENFRFDAVSVWLDNDKKTAKVKHIYSL